MDSERHFEPNLSEMSTVGSEKIERDFIAMPVADLVDILQTEAQSKIKERSQSILEQIKSDELSETGRIALAKFLAYFLEGRPVTIEEFYPLRDLLPPDRSRSDSILNDVIAHETVELWG